jgi:hypothetical protein
MENKCLLKMSLAKKEKEKSGKHSMELEKTLIRRKRRRMNKVPS